MDIRAVIIAGGFGTRMRPLSLNKPKPLLPLANRPVLEYQVAILKKAGIEEIIFATNFLADQIKDHFGDGSKFGVKMLYRVEPEPMDTGGAIRYAVDGLPSKRCVVFNGDIIHDFNLEKIITEHIERKAEVTLTLYRVNRPHPFGVVPVDKDGRVLNFIEPTQEQKLASEAGEAMDGSDLINAGTYIMESHIVDTIPLKRCSIERQIFPELLKSNTAVYGYEGRGYWIDNGRPSQLLKASKAILSGVCRLTEFLPGTQRDGVRYGDNVTLHPSARIEPGCCIGDNCVIEENVHIAGHSIIGHNSKISGETEIDGCMLMENALVGRDCRLSRCIVDMNSTIGDSVRAFDVVLGSDSRIGNWSQLGLHIS